MGKHKKAAKGGGKAPSSHSPTLLSHVVEVGDPYDSIQDLRDKVASLEEALSQMGAFSQMSFWFTHCGRSLSEQSLLLEHQADPSGNKDQTHYFVHVRVT